MHLYILFGLVGLIALFSYIGIYNRLIHSRQKVKEAWSGAEVQLKRRYDLIPALISTVSAYAQHERNLLEDVASERAKLVASDAQDLPARASAEDVLGAHLKSVIAISEAYPDLKSNQNFLKLQEQLAETEDQISAARRIYNSNTAYLNTKIESFPASIVAGIHGFKKAEFFEA